MSVDQWNEAVKAGLESMDGHGAQLGNQADFLPTSSQSPENSPQPSPDSQQKDLGAAVSTQPQAQYSQLQQTQTSGSQQDQQVSQSSDLTRSQSPVFHGGLRPTISSTQEGNTQKLNLSGPVFSSGGATPSYSSQNVHKIQPPAHQHQQQQRPQGPGQNVSSQPHLNPHHLPQPRQVSPQRPTSKMNSPISPSKQQSMLNINMNSSSTSQSCPSGSATENFSRVHQQPPHSQQHFRQRVPQLPPRMPTSQRQLSPGTNVNPRNPQPMGQGLRMGVPRFSHPKQQQNQQAQQQFQRPHLIRGPEGHQNRPRLPQHIPKHEQNFSQQNTNSNRVLTSGAQGKVQKSQNESVPSNDSSVEGGSHNMGHMPDDYMYDEDYDGPMEGGYEPGYEGEDDDEEDYDEDMEEGQYGYDGPPYDYDSEDASDDLSEEESTLFEELSHLPPNHPRYEEIIIRLREKGVERDEIDEIINPQRPGYHQVYGNEPYDEEEGEEDEEMEDNESTVSSSLQSQMERGQQLSTSQAGTRPQQSTVSQSHGGLLQGSQIQNQNSFSSSSQTTRSPSLQSSQPQQSHTQPGQTQPQQVNQSLATQGQQQQGLSQPVSQGHAQRAPIIHHQQQRPMFRPHPPSSSHSPLRPNSQQQQRPKTLANFNQHRKVFQSPAQACSSTTHTEASDWQQPSVSTKSLPSGTATLPGLMNPPRQVGPIRLPAPGQQQVRPAGQIQQGTTTFRAPIQNTIQGGPNPRVQVPLHQGPQAQLLQGGAIQPPMVRGVSPRAHRMMRPGAPVGGPRPFGVPAQGNLRPRTMAPYHFRSNVPHGQFRAPVVASRASQSRLDVQKMQEMLDKQIMAKKGVAVPNQTRAIAHSNQGAEDPSHLPASSSSSSPNTHVFQAPLPRPFLPPRRPISSAPHPMRHPNAPPRRAETPQGTPPGVVSKFNAPMRPRAPVPGSQTIGPSPQQSLLAPQVRMGLQAGTSGAATIPNKSVIPQQGTTNPANDTNKAPQEQQKNYPPGPQTNVSKPPSSSINLDTLTEAKFNLSSPSGKLVINKTYQIKSPIDQSFIYAVWNGEKFVPPGQESGKGQTLESPDASTPSQPQDSNNSTPKTKANGAPSGSSAFQDKFLQSLQESNSKQQESSNSEPYTNTDNAENPPTKVDPPQVPQSTSQATYIKPLPQAQEPSPQRNSDDEEEDEDDDSVFKKPFSENEDVFRVCNNCGYTSKNFKRCDGCKKLFQGEMKIHCTKKSSGKVDMPSPQPSSSGVSAKKPEMKPSDRFREVMSKASFYGNKDASRGGIGRGVATSRRGLGRTKGGGWKGKLGLQTEEEEEDHYSSDEEAEGKRGTKRRSLRQKNPATAPKKRSKKTDEPVTVTISSDEDEPSSTSHLYPGFSPAPSPARSAGSESPIFTTTHMNPVNAFGRFRRVRMEDEEGQSKLQKKLQGSQNNQGFMEQPEEELEEDEDEDGDEPAVYEIDIRSVRIGSMRTQPQQPMFISLNGVCFKCRSERTDEEFECEILCSEVEHVKFFAGQPQPVLFLFLSQECGEKIRNICHMEPGDEEYFDPCCTDMKQKMVVIIIESSSEMPLDMLRENLTLWADVNHQEDSEYLEELSEETTNDLLIQSAPPVLTADVERGVLKFKKRYIYDGEESHIQPYPRMPASPSEGMDNEEPDSTSSSPPDIRHHFFGHPIRLLLYPPPPARGISITTEDLMCLAEGEFLNDVVIDFYLQYLYKEKLSEDNQKRTHIFSSFFYKRLTQRDRHSEKTEEDAKKSLPERRHARVKKWTKHVDLFSKDFIIVPINEHSHWYLAVICFPGLAEPEVVPFMPSAVHRPDTDETSNDGGGTESGATSKDEGNSSQETELKQTILGRQLSPMDINSVDGEKLVGQIQPCILMFDSLAGPSRNPNVKMLREYLQCEWNAKKQEERQIAKIVRGSTPKVPQQSNFSDCGVFLLQYVESFFEDPIADFAIPMKGLQNWFPEEVVLNKRRDIHELIMSLHQVYMEDRGDPRILDIPFESTPRRPPPPVPMDIPNPNNHEHFLGKPDEGPGPGGALSRDDENSNSSAAWELAKPVPSPPFPVALRQNTMFESEESNQSPFLPNSDTKNEEEMEEEEGEEEEVDLAGSTQESQSQLELEDSDNVNNTAEKDEQNETEVTDEQAGESEETCTTEEGTEGEKESTAEQSESGNQC